MAIKVTAQIQFNNPFARISVPFLTKQLMDYENGFIRDIKTRAEKYPRGTGGKYVRTFALKRAWKVRPAHFEGGALVTSISNDAVDPRGQHYAPKVKGDDTGGGQRTVHQGRWTTLLDDATKHDFVQGAQVTLDRAIKGQTTVIRQP